MNYQTFTVSQQLLVLILRVDTREKVFNCIGLVWTSLHCQSQGPILLNYQLFYFSRAVLIQNDEGVNPPSKGILPQIIFLHLEQSHNHLHHPQRTQFLDQLPIFIPKMQQIHEHFNHLPPSVTFLPHPPVKFHNLSHLHLLQNVVRQINISHQQIVEHPNCQNSCKNLVIIQQEN